MHFAGRCVGGNAIHYSERPIGWSEGDVFLADALPSKGKKVGGTPLKGAGPNPVCGYFREYVSTMSPGRPGRAKYQFRETG